MDKHVGVYIEGDRKYVLVRTVGTSNPGQITVYHLDGNTLRKITEDHTGWPELFFGFTSCTCHLNEADLTHPIRKALGLRAEGYIGIIGASMGGHHTGNAMGDMHGMYNHMGSKMSGVDAGFRSGNAMGDMHGMYNHMGSKMSGVDAGFRRGNGAVGNEMFADMA